MTKRALIAGITGQGGSYLAEPTLSKSYEVHGVIRRASTFNTARIEPGAQIVLHYGDRSHGSRLVTRLLEAVRLSGIQIHRDTAMPIGRALAWIKRVIYLPDIPVVLSSVNTVAVRMPA